jgi:hypothetical protein
VRIDARQLDAHQEKWWQQREIEGDGFKPNFPSITIPHYAMHVIFVQLRSIFCLKAKLSSLLVEGLKKITICQLL